MKGPEQHKQPVSGQRGQRMHPKLRKVDEFCSLPFPPANHLISGPVYEGDVCRIIVEPGVHARRSMLLLASACLAAGVPFGPCEAQQPSLSATFLSGGASDDRNQRNADHSIPEARSPPH